MIFCQDLCFGLLLRTENWRMPEELAQTERFAEMLVERATKIDNFSVSYRADASSGLQIAGRTKASAFDERSFLRCVGHEPLGEAQPASI
jgi:hypothetical protein